MESTKESQSDPEDESEEEETDEEGEGSEGEVVEGNERAEVEEDVEDVGSSVEELEDEGEEPDGSSAKLWGADLEQANKGQASTSVGQLASKVEKTLSVSKEKEIRDKAGIEAYKQRAREKQKYHSRRGAERIGRAKGSKAKQDNRVKLDKGGLWD
jgi:RIO kinase 2